MNPANVILNTPDAPIASRTNWMLILAIVATWFLRRLGDIHPEWAMEPVLVDSIVTAILGGGITRHSLKAVRIRKARQPGVL